MTMATVWPAHEGDEVTPKMDIPSFMTQNNVTLGKLNFLASLFQYFILNVEYFFNKSIIEFKFFLLLYFVFC